MFLKITDGQAWADGAQNEVIVQVGKDLGVILSASDEILAWPGHDQVEAQAGADDVVARPALDVCVCVCVCV